MFRQATARIKLTALPSDILNNIISTSLFPFSLPYSGYTGAESGISGNTGKYGVFWADKAYSKENAFRMNFHQNPTETLIDTTAAVPKGYGFSVCHNVKTLFSSYFHSRFRTQATSAEIVELMSLRARTASSGRLALIQLLTLGA